MVRALLPTKYISHNKLTMFEKIIEDKNLTCTEAEFQSYMDNVSTQPIEWDLASITYEEFTYDIPYNGNTIENIANSDIYYIINALGRVYLQTHQPFVGGLQPITQENKTSIINGHIDSIKDMIRSSYKFGQTVEHFTP